MCSAMVMSIGWVILMLVFSPSTSLTLPPACSYTEASSVKNGANGTS